MGSDGVRNCFRRRRQICMRKGKLERIRNVGNGKSLGRCRNELASVFRVARRGERWRVIVVVAVVEIMRRLAWQASVCCPGIHLAKTSQATGPRRTIIG